MKTNTKKHLWWWFIYLCPFSIASEQMKPLSSCLAVFISTEQSLLTIIPSVYHQQHVAICQHTGGVWNLLLIVSDFVRSCLCGSVESRRSQQKKWHRSSCCALWVCVCARDLTEREGEIVVWNACISIYAFIFHSFLFSCSLPFSLQAAGPCLRQFVLMDDEQKEVFFAAGSAEAQIVLKDALLDREVFKALVFALSKMVRLY